MTAPLLPNPRLVVTGHDDQGASIIEREPTLTPFTPFGPGKTGFTVFHSTPVVPVTNNGKADIHDTNTIPRPVPHGAIFCTSDIPPHYSSPMHRTDSVDYTVIMSGEMTLTVDGGDETVIKAGDVILQRGANHMWTNKSAAYCRMLFVMLGAEKVVLENGEALS